MDEWVAQRLQPTTTTTAGAPEQPVIGSDGPITPAPSAFGATLLLI